MLLLASNYQHVCPLRSFPLLSIGFPGSVTCTIHRRLQEKEKRRGEGSEKRRGETRRLSSLTPPKTPTTTPSLPPLPRTDGTNRVRHTHTETETITAHSPPPFPDSFPNRLPEPSYASCSTGAPVLGSMMRTHTTSRSFTRSWISSSRGPCTAASYGTHLCWVGVAEGLGLGWVGVGLEEAASGGAREGRAAGTQQASQAKQRHATPRTPRRGGRASRGPTCPACPPRAPRACGSGPTGGSVGCGGGAVVVVG